jgi:hypothetical protein
MNKFFLVNTLGEKENQLSNIIIFEKRDILIRKLPDYQKQSVIAFFVFLTGTFSSIF